MIGRYVLEYRTPYPTSTDRLAISNYLATVSARRRAVEEVRRCCVPVIDRVIENMRKMYPDFAKYHGYGFEKGHRDMVLITQMVGNAMFIGEHETLDEMFTEWYRTILKSGHLSPSFVRDAFALWQEELRKALSEESYSLIRPVAEHVALYLCRIPVPPRDETGRRVRGEKERK